MKFKKIRSVLDILEENTVTRVINNKTKEKLKLISWNCRDVKPIGTVYLHIDGVGHIDLINFIKDYKIVLTCIQR